MSEAPDLARWLLDQIAEDERLAQDATGTAAFQSQTGKWSPEWTPYGGSLIVFAVASEGAKTQVADLTEAWYRDERAAHIATWDPARVLAECEAKREIVETHEAVRLDDFEPWCTACGCLDCDPSSAGWPCVTLRLLALPYADREGYDESWRP